MDLLVKHGMKQILTNFTNANMILNNEMERLKYMNNYLNDKVNKLEFTLSSILTSFTIKDDIMNIKEDISFIKEKLLEKENIKSNTIIQTEISGDITPTTTTKSNLKIEHNITNSFSIINSNIPTLQSLETKMKITNINQSGISCLINLSTKQLACGSFDGSISIIYVNLNINKCIVNTCIQKAHQKGISFLFELRPNILISGSFDTTMKIWDISTKQATLLKTITEHKGLISHINILVDYGFVSCSFDDKTVKVWNGLTYANIPMKFEKQVLFPNNMLQLKDKQLVISCITNYTGDDGHLVFYNLNKRFNNKRVLENVFGFQYGLIQLSNENVVAFGSKPMSIVVFDPIRFIKVKQIENKVIPRIGALQRMKGDVFIYGRKKCFCQINSNYEIVYSTQNDNGNGNGNWYGEFDFVVVDNDKYLFVDENRGLTVYELKYK